MEEIEIPQSQAGLDILPGAAQQVRGRYKSLSILVCARMSDRCGNNCHPAHPNDEKPGHRDSSSNQFHYILGFSYLLCYR